MCDWMCHRALYAVGGRDETKVLSCVEKYDLQFGTWTTVASLPQPLCCMTALGYKGKLYVFGGESTTDIVNTAFRFSSSDFAKVLLELCVYVCIMIIII